VLGQRFGVVAGELQHAPIVKTFEQTDVGFHEVWKLFTRRFTSQGNVGKKSQGSVRRSNDDQRLYTDFKSAFNQKGVAGLDDRIKYAFYGHVMRSRFNETDIKNQMAVADLRYPAEWYPATRQMHRQIHLHVGPTNSGKTYHALKRLEAAESGIYAGPLRLLAHEVYTRLNAQGKRCILVTGEERRKPDESLVVDMSSCTVEMMPLNKTVDVAVIDEIQMIGNADRGWAWTQALMGVKANEVHLCGEARTVPLIKELCASVGEKVIVHEYTRLSPLEMAGKSLEGNFKELRKGDCIVSFSVVGIHALRRQIEQVTGRKVAIVYGSLPPETRAQQARLFNDPDNDFDFLVASDAVGMGLNLSIKRIIFEEASKFDGESRKTLPIADIKQIAGRAGRYRSAFQANQAAAKDLAAAKGENKEDTAVETVHTHTTTNEESTHPIPLPTIQGGKDHAKREAALDKNSYIFAKVTDAARLLEHEKAETSAESAMATRAPLDTTSVGLVTTLEKFDFPIIQSAMTTEPEPIRTAGLFPPGPIVERFAQYFPPGTPFSFILIRLHELSQTHTRFHLCGLRDQLHVADLIEPVRDLTITDRIILCACPASRQDKVLFEQLLPALARCIEQQGGGDLLEIAEMPLEVLELEASPSRTYLRQLELLHKGIIAYLWLSYRFAGVFTTRPLAFHVKSLVEEKIENVLSGFSYTELKREKIRKKKEKQDRKRMERQLLAETEGKEDDDEMDEDDEDEDEEDDDEDDEEDGHVARRSSPPDDQTSIVSGGDHFSGEEDLGIFDDAPSPATSDSEMEIDLPDALNEVDEQTRTASSSATGFTPDTQTEDSKTHEKNHDGEGEKEKDSASGAVEGMPPKHFQEMDTSAAEVERDVASRP